MPQRYTVDKEGKVVPYSEAAEPPPSVGEEPLVTPIIGEAEEGQVEGAERVDKNADLFEVPQPEDNDIRTDHLFETEGMGDISGLDDDLSDLFDNNLDREPGTPVKKRYKVAPKYRRTARREPPLTSMGGLNV